jgi:uncharacterized protein (DUF1499 family)
MKAYQDTLKHEFTWRGAFIEYLGPGGFALALLSGVAAVLAGLGSRWEWWHFRTGFELLRWAAVGGLAAAVISLAGGIAAWREMKRAVFLLAVAGLAVGLATAGIPWRWMQTAQQVPRIHDITTDTANPPAFMSILLLRKDAANPAEYGGPAIAAQQRAAYPDIDTLILPVPADTAFERALRTARDMGWQVVDASAAEGRIEAVATTFWFGFKDDVVVRIAPASGGSKVDIRSVSRVGVSDVGANAERIRTFTQRLAGIAGVDRSILYMDPFGRSREGQP